MSARCRSLLIAFFLTPLIHAAPAWQAELTSPTPGRFATLVPTVLDFQVSWNGAINAGNIRIEFAPPPSSATFVPCWSPIASCEQSPQLPIHS